MDKLSSPVRGDAFKTLEIELRQERARYTREIGNMNLRRVRLAVLSTMLGVLCALLLGIALYEDSKLHEQQEMIFDVADHLTHDDPCIMCVLKFKPKEE